jgi:energy-coupling factor transport system substrate-specific component
VNVIAWIQGLDGLTLGAAICLLLFIEEAGVPLPIAPGDLLLAVAGIGIAAGKVSPVVMPLAATASIVAGAMVGREVFALIGWERLMRVAGPLRARDALERAGQLIDRSGWRAVFTARLIPGLRVHTTQMAGIRGMPRRTFIAGLIPAAVLYVAAFVGLGAAFGRPILDLIRRAEHEALLAILLLLGVLLAVLWLRGPAQRALAAAGGWTGLFKVQLDSAGLVVIPACIGINFAGHAIAVGLGLPLFLDSIGTVLCAVLMGPWVGGSVGFITNLLSSNTIDPVAAPYSLVSFAVGFAAGLTMRLSRDDRRLGWLALWPVCFVTASVLSTPLNIAFNDGHSGVPLGDAITARLAGTRLPPILPAYLGEAAIDLPDKLIAVAAALLVFRGLPVQPAERSQLELDIGHAFASVVRSPGWLRRILVGAACLLFSWLLVPFFLFMGYTVAVARRARAGEHGPTAWDHLGRKLRDGLAIGVLLLAWYLPVLLLGIPVELANENAAPDVLGALAVVVGVWQVLVLVLQPAIWSQYLAGGLRAGFDVLAIGRRVRFNLGLTVVIGAVGVLLTMIALGGALVFAVGALLTIPYASWVGADLFGEYARITDPAVSKPPTPGTVRA